MIFKYHLLLYLFKIVTILLISNHIKCVENQSLLVNNFQHRILSNNLIDHYDNSNYNYYTRNATILHQNQNHDIEGRKKKPKQKNLLQRILPMFLIPFLVQSAILPIILSGMKFMLLKSLTIGKIALVFMILNIIRRNDYSENDTKHYGYSGNEEYGAYVH